MDLLDPWPGLAADALLPSDDPTPVRVHAIRKAGRPFLVFYVVEGGGHVVPQPAVRMPRMLGPVTGDLNGPAAAIDFFLGIVDRSGSTTVAIDDADATSSR